MERVFSVEQLYTLARDRRAVISKEVGMCLKPRPAAFLLNLPAVTLLGILRKGVFVYTKEPKS